MPGCAEIGGKNTSAFRPAVFRAVNRLFISALHNLARPETMSSTLVTVLLLVSTSTENRNNAEDSVVTR